MTRIHFTDIVFDVARGLYEAGNLIKPQWGPVIIALSTGRALVAIRLIISRQNRLTARPGRP